MAPPTPSVLIGVRSAPIGAPIGARSPLTLGPDARPRPLGAEFVPYQRSIVISAKPRRSARMTAGIGRRTPDSPIVILPAKTLVVSAKQRPKRPGRVTAGPNSEQLGASLAAAFVVVARAVVVAGKRSPRAKGGAAYTRRAADQSIPTIPFAHAPIIVSAKQRVKHVGFTTANPNQRQQAQSIVFVFISAMRSIVIPANRRPRAKGGVLANPNLVQQTQASLFVAWARAIIVAGKPVKRRASLVVANPNRVQQQQASILILAQRAIVVAARPVKRRAALVVAYRPQQPASIVAAFVAPVRPIIVKAGRRARSGAQSVTQGPHPWLISVALLAPGGGGGGGYFGALDTRGYFQSVRDAFPTVFKSSGKEFPTSRKRSRLR